MKTLADVMTTEVVWVSPSARTKTAVILMKGHGIGALPVVHSNDRVVGMVTYQGLLGEPGDAAVMDVMDKDFTAVEPEMSVYDAAELMHRARASHLLVMEGDRLAGIVSHGDLMPELGKNFDPLTEMPWSDALRDWAMNALKQRQEVSMILLDLDEFGKFNKAHGHVVGDRVLQEVAGIIKSSIDPDLDLACRYGGDEFGIVSIRHADDATALADAIAKKISVIGIDRLPEPVAGSYGLSGGRRTKEREDVHYSATIDDLITRASKECIANKPHRAGEAAPAQPTPAAAAEAALQPAVPVEGRERLKIGSISLTTTGAEAEVSVSLSLGDREYRRGASGYVIGGTNLLRLVADAAAGAACKSLAPGHGIVVDKVLMFGSAQDEEIVTVVAVFITPKWSTRHVGSAVVKRGDQYRAAAAALLSAVNRQIENAPKAEPEEIGPQTPQEPEPREEPTSE